MTFQSTISAASHNQEKTDKGGWASNQWAKGLKHLSATQNQVLAAIADHANEYGESCYPSIPRLAKITGLAESTIRAAIKALDAMGAISVLGTPGKVNSYTLHMEWGEQYFDFVYVPKPENRQHCAMTPQQDQPQANASPVEVTPPTVGAHPADSRRTPRRQSAPNHHLTSNEPPESVFDKFFGLYPKPTSRPKALQAYQRALKKVSHETIMDGVRSYIADLKRDGTEKRYIVAPAKWLDEERWDDGQDNPDKTDELRNFWPGAEAFVKYYSQRTWNSAFGDCKFRKETDALVIEVPGHFKLDWIKREYAGSLSEILQTPISLVVMNEAPNN